MTNDYVDEEFISEKRELPLELRKFNWGAFFLTWIWGLGNRTYITFISLVVPFIPVLGLFYIVLCIWFGIKGNEWALKNRDWESVEHFQKVQKNWAGAGLVIFVIYLMGAIYAVQSVQFLNTNEMERVIAYKKASTLLKHKVMIEEKQNDKIDMSSEKAVAKALSRNLKVKGVYGNKFTMTDGTTYTFKCSNEENCTVTVDINGYKGPNLVANDVKHLYDQIEFKIVKNPNGTHKVIKPKWFEDAEKVRY